MHSHAANNIPNAYALTLKALLATLLWLALLLAGNSHAQSTETAQAQSQQAHVTAQSQSDAQGAPNYAALADVLENTETRQALIEQLRSMPATDAPAGEPGAAPATRPAADPQELSLSQRIAAPLQAFTADLFRNMAHAADIIRDLASGNAPVDADGQSWSPALTLLALVIAVTLVAYFIFRLIARTGYARLNQWISHTPAADANHAPTAPRHRGSLKFSRKLLGVLAALVIDIAASFLAALAGYIATLALASETGETTSAFAVQFLSAFVMIEIAKAFSRGIFATRYDHLRLLPISPDAATYWNRWLTLLIGVVGYGLLVLVPIVADVLAPSVAKVVSLVLMLAVYLYAIRTTWANRKSVRAGLWSLAQSSSAAIFGTMLRILGRIWHVIALIYFTVLLVVSQTNQQEALSFMVGATVQSAVAIFAGMILSALVNSLMARHVPIPEHWSKALPLLEKRVNAYVPAALKAVKLVILVVVALLVLDAWRAFDLAGWIDSSQGRAAIAGVFHVALILAIAALAWTVLASIIEHRLGGSGNHLPTEREKTLLMLFRNAAAIVIITMTILVVLSQIGIDIGPLIAGAGVVGLAIGFGAQKLVQDVITGVFIQLENGMNQNDIVELAGIFGTVEKITVRSVVIRTLDGGYHLIPFSTIDKLTNHTRDYGYHYGEYNVAHRESVDEAIAQLELAFTDLMEDSALSREVMDRIEIPGVTGLNERGFTIRVLIKTTPGNQWAVQRGFNRLVKQRFDAAGIELPYPQTVLHFGRDKTGYAAPVDVRGVDTLREVAGGTPPPGQTMRPILDSDV